jgi:signal transduction histidine kinase
VTTLSFRRDVKIFLTLLLGFFVVLILTLLLLLQEQIFRSQEMLRQEHDARADQIATAIDRAFVTQRVKPEEVLLEEIRRDHGVRMIALVPRGGRSRQVAGVASGPMESISRQTNVGRVEVGFDSSGMRTLQNTFRFTAGIVVAAAVAGWVLLLLYIPRIMAPVEELLDRARELGERPSGVEETRYLVQTFQQSIDTLREQEIELRRLHASEKSRADELQRTTATLTRSLTSGFLAVNVEGRVVELNQAGREILRVPSGEPLDGKSVREFLGFSAFADVLEEAMSRRAAVLRREVAEERGGEKITIGLTTVPVRDDRDSYLGMLAIFTDLTGIRVLEERVRDMQNLADLGQMSAGIAHEFRNALSTIQGYLKLATKSSSPEEILPKVERAAHEATSLAKAVDGLLSFARPMPLDSQRIELRSLTDSVIDQLRPLAPNVEFDLHGDAVVIGDPALLTRAVENLVRNAIEAIDANDRGRVTIAITEDPPTVSIEDNGRGLPPGDPSVLFLPFQSTKPSGHGLGLSLVRKIVILHEGSLQLRNREGGGARASIQLPRAPETQ